MTFLGTNFSTLVREGKLCKPKDALDQEAPWVSQDGSITIPSHQVAAEMQEIGSALALLQLSKFQHHIWKIDSILTFLEGTIEDYEQFIEEHGKVLHPNHYHMLTAKHTLCQMLGRTEGCVIQDMSIERVKQF